ncbi:MAG: type II toxin-antitoxin system Phd/YefM family antitoxin [Methylococcales bacterium]|nr:type II toxin-antitoxin system Phd/YefM family antitoxin [Methylococcales bacterium]
MLNISLQEAREKLPELISLAEQGEEVFIISENKSKFKLVYSEEKPKKRVFGQHREKVKMSDDFNNSLPDNFWLGSE